MDNRFNILAENSSKFLILTLGHLESQPYLL